MVIIILEMKEVTPPPPVLQDFGCKKIGIGGMRGTRGSDIQWDWGWDAGSNGSVDGGWTLLGGESYK